ncbi:hypothetical protein NDU88_004910 [Pleurodeles waltl]|uniref:Uncharacterized protein n=1 Tax=Pleurodeles waltl TaxID=8319 RepID=A0AAV7WAC5_PLEWA|nr:hypothetical protein NDU88_004910 [Pleurodeles waltl]
MVQDIRWGGQSVSSGSPNPRAPSLPHPVDQAQQTQELCKSLERGPGCRHSSRAQDHRTSARGFQSPEGRSESHYTPPPQQFKAHTHLAFNHPGSSWEFRIPVWGAKGFRWSLLEAMFRIRALQQLFPPAVNGAAPQQGSGRDMLRPLPPSQGWAQSTTV